MPVLCVVSLVLACLAWIFAFSFLMAAVFTFASNDQKPLDPETDKMLSRSFWLSGGRFAYVFVVVRGWHQNQLGRRLFYAGLASGTLAVAFSSFAMRG